MTFRFAFPAAFLLFFLPLAYIVLTRFNHFSRPKALFRFSDIRLFDGLTTGWRVRLRRLPDALRLIAWVLLVVALARPQSGHTQDIIRGQGIDIVLALDISGSMAALDF